MCQVHFLFSPLLYSGASNLGKIYANFSGGIVTSSSVLDHQVEKTKTKLFEYYQVLHGTSRKCTKCSELQPIHTDQVYHEVSATLSRTIFDLIFGWRIILGYLKILVHGGFLLPWRNMGMFLKRDKVINDCPSYDQFSSAFCSKTNTTIASSFLC